MRLNGLLLLLVILPACGSVGDERAELAETTFDGAQGGDTRAELAHGERLALVLGCRGCHGKELAGERFYELYASNLTRDVHGYSDDQLERLIRHGIHPTGRDVWGMPSEIFQHLGQADLAALMSYLRTLEPAGGPTQPRLPWQPDAEELIALGKLKPAATAVRETRSIAPIDLGPRYALGRYIARVTCAECHGANLEGGDNPDLIVAAAYSREEFESLMTQGIALGGRKLGELMANVAIGRFSHLTKHERDELYAYLKARAERPS